MEPLPRDHAVPYRPFQWPHGPAMSLEVAAPRPLDDLTQLLRRRRTRREFGALNFKQLSNLLGAACQTSATRSSPFGFAQELRAHPSAGAVHPIHVLCQLEPGGVWVRYDPVLHSLVDVAGSGELANHARGCAEEILGNCGAGTLLVLAAEPGRTESKYTSAQSLVWRDAGVVLGYLSVVAEALELNLCPLGVTGDAFVSPIAPVGVLQGAGMLVVGDRPAA